MSHTHLSDDRLLDICFNVSILPHDRSHLKMCLACETRRADLAGMIADVTDIVVRDADAAFPAERLARQRARILQRIEQDGRPARVIHFPAGHKPDAARQGRRRRWGTVAAAVAASFLIGLLAEHLAHDLPGGRQTMPPVRSQTVPPSAAILAAAAVSDDELLGQVELAASGVGPAVLRPLDALTPRAWDVR